MQAGHGGRGKEKRSIRARIKKPKTGGSTENCHYPELNQECKRKSLGPNEPYGNRKDKLRGCHFKTDAFRSGERHQANKPDNNYEKKEKDPPSQIRKEKKNKPEKQPFSP